MREHCSLIYLYSRDGDEVYSHIEEIRNVCNQIKNTHKENIHRIEEILLKHNSSSKSCLAYFTNSISIAPRSNEETIIIGKFHIVNLGHAAIHKPVLLFTIKSDSDIKFSGKFASEGKGSLGMFEWERVKTKGDAKKEYCFKSLKFEELPPGEKMEFPDFQLKFVHRSKTAVSMEGFLYYEENPEGIKSLNSIHITT